MLTLPQQRALTTENHVAITANAGSGKTSVLVERYLRILLEGKARIGEVVAITFTEKAAGELRRRIADRVESMLLAEGNTSTRLSLVNIRDALSTGIVGTIHGFCARVLREFPVEAGVDAAFVVLEGVDRQLLLEQARNEVLRDILTGHAHPVRAEVVATVRDLGKPRMLRILNALLQKREAVARLTGPDGVYSHPDEVVMSTWREVGLEYTKDEARGGTLLEDLTFVLQMAAGPEATTAKTMLEELDRITDDAHRMVLLMRLLPTVMTASGGIKRSVIGQATIEKSRIRRLAERSELFTLLQLDPAEYSRRNEKVLQWTRTLLDVVIRTYERYDAHKLNSGHLDFDDLQLKMRQILALEEVRQRLQRRYKFIMVDEYQDTNIGQYEILLPLLEGLNTGNLCIVGDPKQSIYGFRGADVGVFNRTRREIIDSSLGAGDVVLGESFRPLAGIAAFVNTIFSRLMKACSMDDVHHYDPLICSRKNSASGRVEILLQRESDGPAEEAETVAKRIRQLHDAGTMVFSKDEAGRPVEWSDIAVLLRNRITLEHYEEAFGRNRIPYAIAGGVGYFQTQNILDFYNYLCFILNPHDDVALVGVLRSPFYSVSDAELFEALASNRTDSVWEHLLRNAAALAAFPGLSRAVAMLQRHHSIGNRLGVAELLECIIEHTGYLAIAANIPRSGQGLANLRKLQHLARAYDARGFTTLLDFTTRLKHLIKEEEKEGQGTVEAGVDGVRIMTVHAAKGIEFPVVFAPGLHAPWRLDIDLFIDESLGIAFSGESERFPIAPITRLLKVQSAHRIAEEEKRIFYVCCTRARDILVLSGSMRPHLQSWMRWVWEGLGVTLPTPGILRRRTALTRFDGIGVIHEEYDLEIHLVDRMQMESVAPRQVTTACIHRQSGDAFVEPIPGRVHGEIYSATKIATFIHCPALYHLRHALGMPGDNSFRVLAREATLDTEQKLHPAERGVIIHAALQRIGNARSEDIADLVRNAMSVHLFPVDELSGEVDRIADTILSIIRSDFWRSQAEITDVQTEFSLTAALGDDYVTGTIDRFYRDMNGIPVVLDFKTDEIQFADLLSRAEQYSTQMDIYAWLASRLVGAPVRTVLLFSAHPRHPVAKDFDAAALEVAQSRLTSAISSIKSMKFNNLANQCPSCPFSPAPCPVVLPAR